jgi:putative transposon-encoded protein
MKDRKINGKLFLNEIDFDECLKCKVLNAGGTSARINIPRSWIGKTVYVIHVKEEVKTQ